ncbi:MAG: hypothetical protein V1859_08250 [archaeon]
MKKRCGQIAMEYIVMVGIVFLILIPAMYLLRNYVSSSKDQIIGQKLNVAAHEILSAAKEVYYYGVPSKKVIEIEMPAGIENMGVFFSSSPYADYELIFAYNSEEGIAKSLFQSDVPILAFDGPDINDPANSCYVTNSRTIQYSSTDPTCNSNNMAPECGVPNDCICNPQKDFSPGKKYFKVEAVKHSIDYPCFAGPNTICVIIDEVSSELSCP